MLLVETFIAVSPGKGIGLFAKVHITKGTKYWVRNEVFDKIISQDELMSIEKLAVKYIKTHGFLEKSLTWYLCGDNARFSNHSKLSNTKHHFNSEGIIEYCTASKDILEGEEILCDYTEICLTCVNGVTFKEIE